MKLNQQVKDLLKAREEKKLAEAKLTLSGYSNRAAYIGEHSTNDLYADIYKAWDVYTSATDALELLSNIEVI